MTDKQEPKKDKLATLLNLNPMIVHNNDLEEIVEQEAPETPNEQMEGDFQTARESMLEVMKVAQEAVESIAEVAKQSQAPRAYEVLAKLVDSVLGASKDIMEIHQKKKELNKSESTPTNQTINNNLTLTSSEMLKMIRENKE